MKSDTKRIVLLTESSDYRRQSIDVAKLGHPLISVRSRRAPRTLQDEISNRNPLILLFNEEKCIDNKVGIRKLRKRLESLTLRRQSILDPQYSVNLDEDTSIFSTSVNVVRDEVRALRRDSRSRTKVTLLSERKEREVLRVLKEEIKSRNCLEQALVQVQTQIQYFDYKNQNLDRQLQQISQQERGQLYLNKLKQIALFQQSSNDHNKHFQDQYQSLVSRSSQLTQTNNKCQANIRRVQGQVSSTQSQISQLLVELYGVCNQSQQQS